MIKSNCRKTNLYEYGLPKIKNHSLRLLQEAIALRDGISWENEDRTFEFNSSLNKGQEQFHILQPTVNLLFKNAALSFFPLEFLSFY